MWPWTNQKQDPLDVIKDLVVVIASLVTSKKRFDETLAPLEKQSPRRRWELELELVALRQFYAQISVGTTLRENWKVPQQGLHYALLDAMQRERGWTDAQVATFENWLMDRLNAYGDAFSSVGYGNDGIQRVASIFADHVKVPRYSLEVMQANLGAIAVGRRCARQSSPGGSTDTGGHDHLVTTLPRLCPDFARTIGHHRPSTVQTSESDAP